MKLNETVEATGQRVLVMLCRDGRQSSTPFNCTSKVYQAKSMHPSQPKSVSHRLDWSHVGFGLAFVAFNSVISQLLQLRIGASLAIAALRCMTQLTVMGAVLQHVFIMKNLWAVAGIACTFSSARSTIVACVTVLTFPSYCSASELYQHHRNRCVLSFEAVILALVSQCHMTNYISHHQGPEKVSTYGESRYVC